VAKNPLDEAQILFRRKAWGKLIQLLEPLEAVYRDNLRFLYILGTAYLHAEDIGAAFSCFRRGRQIDFRSVPIMSGLAAVLIRRGESDKAVQLYIEILERDSRNRLARRGLDYLRKTEPDIDEINPRRNNRLKKLVYPQPDWQPVRLISFISLIVAVFILLVYLPDLSTLLAARANTRPEIDAIQLTEQERAAPVGTEGSFKLILTGPQTISAFEQAKNLFNEFRDEAALIEINRLLFSNASSALKAKAEILKRHVRPPSFLTLPDRFDYKSVAEAPFLFNEVAVAWKGLPANTEYSETSLTFDLLVGYHQGRQLDGIVKVQVPFEFTILEAQALEILGRIRYIPEQTPSFYLEAAAIHMLPLN